MSVNQDLQDAAIRHAIHSERFARSIAKRIVKLLEAADADLADQIAARLTRIADSGDRGPATTKRLTEIMNVLRSLNDKVYRKIVAAFEAELTDFAAFEIEHQTSTLNRIIPVTIAARAPTATYLKTLVTQTPIDNLLLKPWIEGSGTNRMIKVEQAMRMGMAQGQTVDQIVRRIRGTKAKGYSDGVLQASRHSIETLALTANSTIANAARLDVYRQNSNVIRKLKWVSTLDSRTSPKCQSLDGQVFDLDDDTHPTAPAHLRCRSLLVPITVSFAELGVQAKEVSPRRRASMDGQVPGSTTFGDWLKDQPRERVEQIMGKGRAELFLSGRLKFSEFFKTDNEYYTLEELRRRTSN